MSSDYHVLCLSHDPAIIIDGDWQHPATALAAVADRSGSEHLRPHVDCDLVIGRYSYPLIEVCCPPHAPHHGGAHKWSHNDARWIDVAWLRLAAAADTSTMPAVQTALAALPDCWNPQRLQRLRNELSTD